MDKKTIATKKISAKRKGYLVGSGELEIDFALDDIFKVHHQFQFFQGLVNSFSPQDDLEFLSDHISYFFYRFPKFRGYLEDTILDMVVNMVLYARGTIYWDVTTPEVLQIVINFWKVLGFNQITRKLVSDNISQHYYLRLKGGDAKLLTRLKLVFPKLHLETISGYHHLEITKVFYPEMIDYKDKERLSDQLHSMEDLIYLDGEFRTKTMLVIAKVLQRNCIICHSDTDLETHHLIPLARGGTNHIENLVVVCSTDHDQIHFRKDHTKNWP